MFIVSLYKPAVSKFFFQVLVSWILLPVTPPPHPVIAYISLEKEILRIKQ